MIKKYIAFCEYRCDLCPAYVKNVDKFSNRTVIKNGWKSFFDFDVSEEHIMCVGYSNDGNHLDIDCPVRSCALPSRIQDCSFDNLFESCNALQSRANIHDELKMKFSDKISQEEYELFFRPYERRRELVKKKKERVI